MSGLIPSEMTNCTPASFSTAGLCSRDELLPLACGHDHLHHQVVEALGLQAKKHRHRSRLSIWNTPKVPAF